MAQDATLEEAARRRLRSLRTARGWSLDDLAARSHISALTLSRLESGRRRLAVDHLVTLARVLETSVEDLVAAGDDGDVVIRPRHDESGRTTFWRLSHRDDPTGRTVVKMRIPELEGRPSRGSTGVATGSTFLTGVVRLRLGERDVYVEAGNAAGFSTR